MKFIRFRNTAVAAVEQPEAKNITVNQHEASRAGETLATGALILAGAFILWHVSIYVLSEMGFRKPVSTLGWGAFYLLVILAIVWLPAKALEKMVGMGLAAWKEGKQIESETRIQIQRLQLQLAQSTPIGTTRTLENDGRKADIIQAILAQAYDFIETHERNFTHNDAKPWTWNTAKGQEVNGKAITEAEARQIKYWLQQMDFVDGDQVNLERYPDMNAVNKYLRMTFELPIVYKPRSLPSSREDHGYVPIDESP